jgi:hypothetical protein
MLAGMHPVEVRSGVTHNLSWLQPWTWYANVPPVGVGTQKDAHGKTDLWADMLSVLSWFVLGKTVSFVSEVLFVKPVSDGAQGTGQAL